MERGEREKRDRGKAKRERRAKSVQKKTANRRLTVFLHINALRCCGLGGGFVRDIREQRGADRGLRSGF